MLNKKGFIYILIFVVSNVFSQNLLNLEQLIELALKNNSSIKIEKYTQDEKKAAITSAKSSYLPKLSAKADLSSYDILQSGTTIKDSTVSTYSLSANQLIYDFGKSSYSIDLSKQDYEASKKALVISINKIVLDVKNIYYDILKKQELIKVALESLKIDKQQVDKIENYVQAGIKTKIDITNAKLALSTSKLDLLKARYALKQTNAKLITILGTNETYSVINETYDFKKLNDRTKILDQNLDYYIKKGLENRVELKRYKDLVNVNKSNLKSSKSTYYPKLDFNATYSNTSSQESSLDKEQTIAGVSLSWDFFTGFSTNANVKKNLSSLNKAKESLKNEYLSISQNITDAYILLIENFESFKISYENLNLAKENLFLSQERYKNGLNDIYELNSSKLKFIEAKSTLVTTYYDYKISLSKLQFQTGNTL